MTYKKFMERYEKYMVILEVYNKNGEEIDPDREIADDTHVLGFSARSGSFDVVLDVN